MTWEWLWHPIRIDLWLFMALHQSPVISITANIIIHGYQAKYFLSVRQQIFSNIHCKWIQRHKDFHLKYFSHSMWQMFSSSRCQIFFNQPWPKLLLSAPLTSDLCKNISSDNLTTQTLETRKHQECCVLVYHKLPSSRNIWKHCSSSSTLVTPSIHHSQWEIACRDDETDEFSCWLSNYLHITPSDMTKMDTWIQLLYHQNATLLLQKNNLKSFHLNIQFPCINIE